MRRPLFALAILTPLLLSADHDRRTDYQKALPSCVQVESGDGHGSGVFIAPRLILTAGHVWDLTGVAVLPDGRRLECRRVKYDDSRDLALLQVAVEGNPMPLGDEPRPGDGLFTIGCGNRPFGVARGNCRNVYDHDYPTTRGGFAARVADLDLTVEFGDSGAPVINQSGQLVGIVVSLDGSKQRTSYASIELKEFLR